MGQKPHCCQPLQLPLLLLVGYTIFCYLFFTQPMYSLTRTEPPADEDDYKPPVKKPPTPEIIYTHHDEPDLGMGRPAQPEVTIPPPPATKPPVVRKPMPPIGKGLVTNYGEGGGGYKTGGFTPTKRGGKKSFSPAEGGTTSFGGVFT